MVGAEEVDGEVAPVAADELRAGEGLARVLAAADAEEVARAEAPPRVRAEEGGAGGE